MAKGIKIAGLLLACAFTMFLSACGSAATGASALAAACTAPSAPGGIIATGADGQVSISWNAVSGVSSYSVYWSTNFSSASALATMTKIDGIAASPYTHTGRTNDTTYYYRVTAVSGGCESAASSLVTATPSATNATTGGGASAGSGTGTGSGGSSSGSSGATTSAPSAPANVIAAAANGQITLSWSAVTGATSYKVYMGTSTGVTTANATVSASTSTASHTFTGLANGTAYYFIVTAANSAGESLASSEASATPVAAAARPAAPTGVAATAGDTQVTVTWTAVTGVTTANATGNSTSTVASLTKTGLTNGTAYYFIVTATNAVGEGAASSEVGVTPAAPTGTWTVKANTSAGRNSSAATEVNGTIYVMGGIDAPAGTILGSLGTVEAYTLASNAWTAKTAMPTARNSLAASAVNGIIYAISGKTGATGVVTTVAAYDPATNSWSTKTSMPTARNALACEAANGKIFTMGGADVATVEVYDPAANAWSTQTSMPTKRGFLTSSMVNGRVYAIGGTHTGTPLTNVEEYIP